MPISDLETTVADITDRISENAPLSMKASKLTINELMKDDSAFDGALVDGLTRDCFDSKENKIDQDWIYIYYTGVIQCTGGFSTSHI